MINFRYHVVSLTAVFLALAIGLIVGTAALNGPVADQLKNQVEESNRVAGNMRDQITQLTSSAQRQEDFVTEAAPSMLRDKLTGRKLLVVVLPGAQKNADGVVTMLTTAGATIAGRIDLQEKFLAPQDNLELLSIAERSSQPTVPSAGLPLNSNGVETSSAQLALALLERTPPVAQVDLKTVLAVYSSGEYLTVGDNTVGGAEGTVLVSGSAAVDKDAAARNANAVTAVTQWSKNKPLVVAGSGIGTGNLVSQVRDDPPLAKNISTVDDVDTAQGRLVTALAVAERLTQNRAGHYGLGTGAESLMPKTAS